MKNKTSILLFTVFVISFWSCKKDKDPIFHIQPSQGTEVTLNGIAGDEPGTAAGNSVYLNLRTGEQTAVLRSGWDLGFYCGDDFRVIINNTTSAGAEVLTKTDLSDVSADDTIGLTLAYSPFDPVPSDLAFYDDIEGDLSKTVIPAVSANDADNHVVILNRGTGGGIPARPWIKLKITRNGSGYTLQYGRINDNSFKVVNVSKDPNDNFRFVSFDQDGVVPGEPQKDQWDFVWTYSVFESDFGDGMVPFNFSDLIAINYLGGVQVAQKVYADAATAADAYTHYNMDSVRKTTLADDRWAIGANWRSTVPATGARTDRFYIIKDTQGNFYKLRCLAMGVGTDGGIRGEPEFGYGLIQ